MKKIRLSTIALDRDTFIGGTLETFEDDEGIYRSTITDMRFYQDKNGPELHVAVSSLSLPIQRIIFGAPSSTPAGSYNCRHADPDLKDNICFANINDGLPSSKSSFFILICYSTT